MTQQARPDRIREQDRAKYLVHEIAETGKVLVHFVVIMGLTAILAVLRLIPFLLRVLAVLLWIVGMALSFVSAHALFAMFADDVAALMAGIGAVALCLLIPVAFFMTQREKTLYVWGGFFFAALVALGLAVGMNWIILHPELYPVVNTMPVVLAGTLLLFTALKVRRINEHRRRTQVGGRSAKEGEP